MPGFVYLLVSSLILVQSAKVKERARNGSKSLPCLPFYQIANQWVKVESVCIVRDPFINLSKDLCMNVAWRHQDVKIAKIGILESKLDIVCDMCCVSHKIIRAGKRCRQKSRY